MLDSRGYQALVGSLLGDGGLLLSHGDTGSAYFSMSQSGTVHLDWLSLVTELISRLGLEFGPEYPKTRPRRRTSGQVYEYCYVQSRVSSLLTALYKMWYPDRVKTIPKSIVLTPITTLVWYIDDGTLGWNHGDKTGAYDMPGSSPLLSFAIGGFSAEEIGFLRARLQAAIGITCSVSHKHGKPESLYVRGGKDGASKFFSYINIPELIPPSYDYKFRGFLKGVQKEGK